MRQIDALEFLPLIKAWGEGKTLQIKDGLKWCDVGNGAIFNCPASCYRIKPETIKFRAALFRSGDMPYFTNTVDSRNYKAVEKTSIFVRWLGEEQEVEV